MTDYLNSKDEDPNLWVNVRPFLMSKGTELKQPDFQVDVYQYILNEHNWKVEQSEIPCTRCHNDIFDWDVVEAESSSSLTPVLDSLKTKKQAKYIYKLTKVHVIVTLFFLVNILLFAYIILICILKPKNKYTILFKIYNQSIKWVSC